MQTEWESGKPETPCGAGSMFENTEQIRDIIPKVISMCGDIETIADVGCGDSNWIQACLPEGIEYTGYDIRPRYVDIIPFNVVSQVLPTGYDLILLITVMNHIKGDEFKGRAYRLLAESGSKYILMSYINQDRPLIPYTLIQSWEHESLDKNQEKKKKHTWMYGLWSFQ